MARVAPPPSAVERLLIVWHRRPRRWNIFWSCGTAALGGGTSSDRVAPPPSAVECLLISV